MVEDYKRPKFVKIQCDTEREISSVRNFLQRVEVKSDNDLEKMFGMLHHEVLDLKDALKRS